MDFRSPGTWWTEARRIAARQTRQAGGETADDLAQDLAVAALQSGQGTDNPAAWLERVAKNAAIDRWRRDDRRRTLLITVDEPTPGRDAEADLLSQERRQAVRRAVAQLPRSQRHVALLRFAGDLPLQTIAARLGTPPATTRSRLHRALASLRQQLRHLRGTMIFGWPAAQTAALSLALVVAATAPTPLPSRSMASPLSSHPRPLVAQARAPKSAAPATVVPPTTLPAPNITRTSAQPAPAPPAALQHILFDDDNIAGDRDIPDGEIIVPIGPPTHASLIELRLDLIPEIAKSLEDL